MNHFRIKVCGMTRVQDALLAEKLGADMVGFVFYKKSPRYMTIDKTKRIIDKLSPTIDKVGVFIEPTVKTVIATSKALKLNYAQIHSHDSASLVRQVKKHGIKTIESFHITRKSDYSIVRRSSADIAQLDNRTKGPGGGTGQRFDWSIKPPNPIANLMLAGGLNAENIHEGVRIFQPLVIDVNSGVEVSPGVKSAAKLKTFFKICNKMRYGSTH